MEIYCVKEVEQNPVPKSQTKPFYIGTKEAPSEYTESFYRTSMEKVRFFFYFLSKHTMYIVGTR